ncbi:putative ring-cleaving dioxygenase MhqA [compost metagenome]
MGFREKGKYPSTVKGQPDIIVFETGEGGSGAEVHLEQRSDLPREQQGYGGVHHIAFRVDNDDELREWIEHIKGVRIPNSGFVDRFYFRSLYFREPNGILFELATDGPGFDTDEDINHLGESLALPPFLEPHRQQIESRLKPLNTKPL